MRKYRIYSGTKPTSADKTFAVNWGGKYFTVSPITGKEAITFPTASLGNSGNSLTFTCTNSGKDSIKAVPTQWTFFNPNVNSASTTYTFNGLPTWTLGPYSKATHTWDVSDKIKPGVNTFTTYLDFSAVNATYQTGGGNLSSSLIINKKFSAPTVTKNTLSFTNSSQNRGNYTQRCLDPYTRSYKVTNPNTVTASYYLNSNSSRSGTLSPGSSVVVESNNIAMEYETLATAPSSRAISSGTYYLDSGSSTTKNSSTVSSGNKATITIPAVPQLISCLPTSTTSSSFQVTVKNNNSEKYFCRVQYYNVNNSSSDYWVANCPANGQATMIGTDGASRTFTFTRGQVYDIALYFFTTANGSLSYSGTQQSRTVHYYYKAPDSGYMYTTPLLLDEVYDDISDPTTVTFTLQNNNPKLLYAYIALYKGSSVANGTRVDYWKVTIGSYSSATCPNTWGISAGTTYTVRYYFMETNSYTGSPVSGYTDFVFTTPTGS